MNASGAMNVGDLQRVDLAAETKAMIVIEPARGFDLGAGPGKRVEREVRGGHVGVILDARGRELMVPEDRDEGRACVARWAESMGQFEEAAVAAGG